MSFLGWGYGQCDGGGSNKRTKALSLPFELAMSSFHTSSGRTRCGVGGGSLEGGLGPLCRIRL